MRQLTYSQLELEAEHDYARPHIECDLKLHGGFDKQGEYVSPRTKHRWPAINNWLSELVSAEITPPNFQDIIVEDISGMALGHMDKGLMTSHGWDEGGNPASIGRLIKGGDF